MAATLIYQGPSGLTIDEEAMEAALVQQAMRLEFYRDLTAGHIRLDHHTTRKITSPDDDPCTAKVVGIGRTQGIVLDEENFTAGELVEGIARLLRRVLPEPAKVIATMALDEAATAQRRRD